MITIVDYGLGNIRAFANVYKNLDIPFVIATNPISLRPASKIILPGVGAFDHAMNLLQQSGMREVLDEMVLGKKIPVLGICVGMQILALSSEEGVLPGLGWINGKVKKFDTSGLKYKTILPHMGWNTIDPICDNPLLIDLNIDSRFYFLHSYYFHCDKDENSIAVTDYGGQFTCVVNYENIYGVQCHPEKSHHNGIRLLRNFAKL